MLLMVKTFNSMLFPLLLLMTFDYEGSRSKLMVTACNKYGDYCDLFEEDSGRGIEEEFMSFNDIVNIDSRSTAQHLKHENQTQGEVEDVAVSSNLRNKRSAHEGAASKKITTILDELFLKSSYDRQIIPKVKGAPVKVNMHTVFLCVYCLFYVCI